MMTPIDHLHTEAKVFKVDEHLKMLCSQHLATCLQPNHISFPIVTADSGPRRMKQSLQMHSSDQVNDLLVGGVIEDIKEARKTIHTRAVGAAMNSRRPNGVLSGPAPEVSEEEVSLSRGARTTLAQLRSGYCSNLNTFKHRIGLIPLSSLSKLPTSRPYHSTYLRVSRTPHRPCPSRPLATTRRSSRVSLFLAVL